MQSLLDLEDAAPDELLEVLPGSTVPFWAQVRMQIAWALSEETTGSVAVKTDDWTRWKEAKRLAKAFLPNRWDARQFARRHDVMFYVGGGTLSTSDGRARNWLVDDFAETSGNATIVQRRPLPSPIGRPAFTPTLSMEGGTARSRLWARGYTTPPETVKAIDRLMKAFAQRLGVSDDQIAGIRSRVMRAEAHRPYELAELRHVLGRVKPRVVIMDTASYTYNGETVGVFKDAGAYVAEPQHGWIGPSHAAYNYGRVFKHPSLLRGLPDEVLTFGDFWSESVRMPVPVTAIGKPHLENRVRSAPANRPRQILVISSRAEPEATDAFVMDLRAAVDADWNIVFRPHPAERGAVESRYPLIVQDDRVSIDRASDVYESLAEARVVVGVASTVLFEAVAFGCQVVARENAFAASIIGDTFGPRVQTASEVAERIAGTEHSSSTSAATDPYIWRPDAVEGYRAWLAGRLSLSTS
ncbi:hypothetical protein GCM10007269_14270 [Microbacterium murale]|uniref:Uncharacterized protein n=2 Tax=Microbacterium murale TaxID=1081040 RepID=A0ABQ1RJ59_9MICO|nr:hypothetical protein GCM10007269_14270 [Microbacterium murale]